MEYTSPRFSVNSFMNSFNNRIEEDVRQHLRNVYACLTMSVGSAAMGASVHMYSNFLQGGFLSAIGALIFCVLLLMTPDNGKNTQLRIGYLLGFSTLSGLGMGPLLEQVIYINPSIIVTALTTTTLIFVSFSLCAMFANRGQWLFLGGTLMSLANVLFFMTLANVFFGSTVLYQIHLYLGLALLCGFVLYDTQVIIEKRRMGSKDFVAHALELFIDFIGIFRRLLIILAQKEENDKRKRRNN